MSATEAIRIQDTKAHQLEQKLAAKDEQIARLQAQVDDLIRTLGHITRMPQPSVQYDPFN